jgi:hypothetical protein
MPPKRAKKQKLTTKQKLALIISVAVTFSALTGINPLSIYQLFNPYVVVVTEYRTNTPVRATTTMTFTATVDRTVTRGNMTQTVVDVNSIK